MFTPKHLKHGRLLLEGVQKFISYKRDILKPERLEEINRLRDDFASLIKAKADKETLEAKAEVLTKACESSVPPVEDPGMRDWVESLLACAVIVFAIRAFFVQPFKIPTGSMQPTLNGIIATPSTDPEPNPIKQAIDFVSKGRNYVHVESPCDGHVVGVKQTSYFLFSYSTIYFDNGQSVRAYAPARQLCGLSVHGDAGLWQLTEALMPKRTGPQTANFDLFEGKVPVKKGELIAAGYIDAGDMVLVDKISYHFRQPHRGEVFVFNTANIPGIQVDPREGSQHYIKRLAGVPGDHLEVKSPNLFVNGEMAVEPGFKKVMSATNGYKGYQDKPPPMYGKDFAFMPYTCGVTPRREYFAMGDNSYNSSDSRYWGRVPEENLVGPGLFSLWPFGSGHWGLIK